MNPAFMCEKFHARSKSYTVPFGPVVLIVFPIVVLYQSVCKASMFLAFHMNPFFLLMQSY